MTTPTPSAPATATGAGERAALIGRYFLTGGMPGQGKTAAVRLAGPPVAETSEEVTR